MEKEWPPIVDIAQNCWTFNEADVNFSTPSRLSGISLEKELIMRAKGTLFISRLCRALKLSRAVSLTASTYLQRFFMRRSLKDISHYDVAAASVFVACKAEEAHRRLKDVVIQTAKLAMKKPGAVIDEQTKEFWRWKDVIALNEDRILKYLCFDVLVETPYKICYDRIRVEKNLSKEEIASRTWESMASNVSSQACEFYEEAFRTPVCLLYSTEMITAVGLVWSANTPHFNTVLPLNYVQDVLGVSPKDVYQCYQYIYGMFDIIKEVLSPQFYVKFKLLDKDEFSRVISADL